MFNRQSWSCHSGSLMNPSKRFVIVNFFAAITMSALCNSIFAIIKKNQIDYNLIIYMSSLFVFLVKYYIDDIVEDTPQNDESKKICTRGDLFFLVAGWIMFLLASICAENQIISPISWLLGLFFIMAFMDAMNPYTTLTDVAPSTTDFIYIRENCILIFMLAVFVEIIFISPNKCMLIYIPLLMINFSFYLPWLKKTEQSTQKTSALPDKNSKNLID